mgnify:CR=1 FL=1
MYLSRSNGACAYTLPSGYSVCSNSTEMVKTCCVYKCRYVFCADVRSRGVSFVRFPKDKRKRRVWVKAVNRDKWEPSDHSWICFDHFLHGWHGDDPSDDNYGPTLFHYKLTRSDEDLRREKRRLDRESTKVCTQHQAYTMFYMFIYFFHMHVYY